MINVEKKIRGGSKTDVYSLLKRAIEFLEMKPGMKIVEAELSQQFGVSRTPVREALKRLEEERLVSIYPQRGTYVAKIDYERVKEMAYMRHVLETEIFLKLCEEKAQVSSVVEDKLLMMKLALKNKDYVSYIQYDREFHRSLFGCAGHTIMWDTIAGFLAHYTRVLILDMMLPDSLEQSYPSHMRIVECIEKGDKDGLLAILEEHHDYNETEVDGKIKELYPDYFV